LTLVVLAAGLAFSAARPAEAQGAPSRAEAAAPAVPADDAQWRQELGAWRGQREREIAAPDGWLTLAGLEWLKPGINSVGSGTGNQIRLGAQAPEHVGLLTVSGEPRSNEIVQLLAPAGGFPAELTLDGKPARDGTLTVDNEKPSAIGWRGLTLVVLKRGDRFVLRIKDADSAGRKGFHGLNWYAPDARYRVTARWIPFKPPQVQEIPTVIGTTLKLAAPGLAMFLIDGQVQHLEPVIEDPQGKALFFILRDGTSTTTTYGGGRFLHTGLPDHGLDQPGNLTLDFNRLENPPCTYTNYATCPLPPEQNRMKVSVEAGEQKYEH
jgi:uncharacterized protein (DUF1684 family)